MYVREYVGLSEKLDKPIILALNVGAVLRLGWMMMTLRFLPTTYTNTNDSSSLGSVRFSVLKDLLSVFSVFFALFHALYTYIYIYTQSNPLGP